MHLGCFEGREIVEVEIKIFLIELARVARRRKSFNYQILNTILLKQRTKIIEFFPTIKYGERARI